VEEQVMSTVVKPTKKEKVTRGLMQLELRCQKCGKTYNGNVMTPCPHCGEKIK
jgi:rubrerythrin